MKKRYKSAIAYNIVFFCLEMLKSINITDEEYQNRFSALFDYVTSKIKVGKGGDIIDVYVINVVDELE